MDYSVKITDLPEATYLNPNDWMLIVQGNTNVTKKVEVQTVGILTENSLQETYINSNINAYSCRYMNTCRNYSTSETDTGKKWIDGKTIYRKVIPDTNITISTSSYELATGISNVDTVISIKPVLWYQNDGMWFTYWHFTDVSYKKSRNVIAIIGDSTATFANGYFILEYTKES